MAKFSSILLFMAVLAFFHNGANGASKSQDLILGNRSFGDRLVVEENVNKRSSFWRIVTKEKTFYVPKYARITAVEALDLRSDGSGAYASMAFDFFL